MKNIKISLLTIVAVLLSSFAVLASACGCDTCHHRVVVQRACNPCDRCVRHVQYYRYYPRHHHYYPHHHHHHHNHVVYKDGAG